jgi:flavin-dependent dehydrogenase
MGMSGYRCSSKRYGYRRHYNVVPWTDHVEVHWSDCGQMYVTPVGATEVCIAFITRIQNLRFDQALAHFSKLAPRLAEVTWQKDFLGAMTTTARLDSVYRGNVAFVGEASGSVDAITGEGLSLAFRQALALAQALRQNDLRRYQAIHRSSASVPRLMCSLMLAMDRHPALRRRALRAMAADSKAFGHLLSIHTGAAPIKLFDVRHGLSLAWNLMAA